jgi:hypothetical protein
MPLSLRLLLWSCSELLPEPIPQLLPELFLYNCDSLQGPCSQDAAQPAPPVMVIF